jgi:MATE family multidrug resistance protein
MLPMHFQFAIILPLNKFFQSQRKNWVMAATAVASFLVHVVASWLLVVYFRFGVLGAAMALNISWGVSMALQVVYAVGGGCPVTWSGFSPSAFADLWGFVKLFRLESWYGMYGIQPILCVIRNAVACMSSFRTR